MIELRKRMDDLSGRIFDSSKRIKRIKSAQMRVLRALSSPAPQGVSRIDWITRSLNAK